MPPDSSILDYGILTLLITFATAVIVWLKVQNEKKDVQLLAIHEERRQDSLANMEVLRDLTEVLEKAMSEQASISGDVRQCYTDLSATIKAGYESLEKVIRNER